MDDPIASLNKPMMFLTTAISSRYLSTNNQLRLSSTPRSQANIQGGRVVVQKVQGRQAQGYSNARRGRGTRNTRVVRTVGDLIANPTNVIKCYNNRRNGHYAKECTTKKRVNDSEWFKENMLLAQQQEAGIEIADEVGPSYDSDILYEVPNYDTYHANDMFNPFVQELTAFEQLVSVNDTYVDFLSDSNVISDNPYSDNNENEVVQEMTSLAQNDVSILSLIENMQHEVTRCNTGNLETKQVNEQLTIELDRYRKQVKILESEKENQLVFTSIEKDLDSKMRKLIVEYNHKEAAFNKEILVLKQELSLTSETNSSLKNNNNFESRQLNERIIIIEYLVNISKRRTFWSLNEDILKITILITNTPYPSRKIRRIRACTHQRPQRKQAQYAVSREDQYAVFKI
ncbi:hypothetical protein Tco_0032196 [Tanacetum coccineum]